jgi:hypothetical protein
VREHVATLERRQLAHRLDRFDRARDCPVDGGVVGHRHAGHELAAELVVDGEIGVREDWLVGEVVKGSGLSARWKLLGTHSREYTKDIVNAGTNSRPLAGREVAD